MEFPEAGLHCNFKGCMQLDFLPISCPFCNQIFCKEHSKVELHSCEKYENKMSLDKKRTVTVKCTYQNCETKDPVEMICEKCKKHFCLSHRHHGCYEKNEQEIKEGLQKVKKNQLDFTQAKSAIDKEINSQLSKSKNSAMASKIQLMKLKSQSVGPNSIPLSERCFFLVYLPKSLESNKNLKNPAGVFVSLEWSIGRVIDSIAESLQIANNNNVANSLKLKLFCKNTGKVLCNMMDKYLKEILETGQIINGQSVVMEYCNEEKIDSENYK